ncbi:CBR-IDA-1 protein [Loa loa]|uniref:CBR-IDA-1 protein n=1 Tax=Loa loa TaxID=7209 RepID=A0A1S0UMK6_LOALO|nr:CBR-IDA-1 protein [Loa loa]EJD76628.1 CBR-IDA-1 protein [Loa loa]
MLELKYDLNFCNVVNPENIWRMLQSIKVALVNDVTNVRSVNADNELVNNFMHQQQQQQRQQIDSTGDIKSDNRGNNVNDFNSIPERNMLSNSNIFESLAWDAEKKTIDNDKNMLAVETFMQSAVPDSGEEEEEQSLNFVGHHAPVLKKDIEHLGNQNTGLEKIEHKIVKGMPSYQKVDGNRVYLKVAKDLNGDKLHHLINYLDFAIAKPNQLIFDDFRLDGGQLSFRAGQSTVTFPQNEKRLDSVGGIAEDVYKRRKDIQTISGVHVDETGIGSGEEAVPVESETRDRFFTPILAVSAFTLVLLVAIMAIHQIREYRRKRRKSNNRELESQEYGEKALLAYQDLCRYQMALHEPAIIADVHTNHSSTASWVEEPVGQSSLDISTGHVILSFLRDYLNDKSKIEEQWKTLNEYTNSNGISSIAREEGNLNKNRNPSCLPYDDTLVSICNVVNDSTYINASAIHDCDPKQANYIATQSPLPETIADFWQMIWEQATVLIVNLANNNDQEEGQCLKYWPESGSQIYGSFEIHLVSEHIWSEDYLVRSFYLKNLRTNETRTVTQFHFLTWPKSGVPPNTKALLDFRRKINKSYRGRAAPIVVHCTDGIGRTGAFCLLDMILNRVTRGVKELNVAGSLEHLRDQRPGLVETCEQYKMVFVCLAEEITAIIATLS